MARPTKPLEIIKSEKKSHRTKAELKAREKNEAAVLSGVCVKEFEEVKNNQIAHERFLRTCEVLAKIKKLDAIYEVVINRYCILFAEVSSVAEERETLMKTLKEAKEAFNLEKENLAEEKKAQLTFDFISCMTKCLNSVSKLDDVLMKKRKMLLDIEKENVMTIAAALRSIPKAPEKEETGPSLKEILGG